jgi:hypothetical protein
MDPVNRHLTRGTAEQLLDGGPGGPAALTRLLTAAASPARPGELASEDACLAGYRSVRAAVVARPQAGGRLRTAVSRLLTLKVGVAALATTLGVGTALAAASSVLPPEQPPGGDGPVVSAPAAPVPATSRTSKAPGRVQPVPPAAPTPTATPPPPSLDGQCRAYTAGNKAEHGKALDNPAFARLVAAAGGKDKVDAYCAGVLGPDDKPGKDHRPGNGGGVHATAKPTAHPGR